MGQGKGTGVGSTRVAQDSAAPGDRAARGSAWAGASFVVMFLAVLAVHASRLGWGLDRTDEGQYLTLMAAPETSRSSVFLFGYVLHPLFALLGGDILGLRVAGLVISVVAAGAVGLVAARLLGHGRIGRLAAALSAGALGIGPLSFFPATPSYNTLAFWGCCVWAIGLLGAALRRERWLGPVLLGAGGVVAFSGKATTGAALALLTIAVALALVATAAGSRSRQARVLAGGVTGGAVVAMAVLLLVVGHGPAWLVDFYSAGARSVALLQGHEDLVRLDVFAWGTFFALPALLLTVALLAGSVAARGTPVAGWVAGVTAAAAVGTVVFGVIGSTGVRLTPTTLLAWWWIPVWIVLALAVGPREPTPTSGPSRVDRLVVAVPLAVLPLVYVVGTNGNYWIAQARAGAFWLVAGLVILSARPARRLILAAVTTLLALTCAVQNLDHAYRYTSFADGLQADSAIADVSPEGAHLRLTGEDAATSAHLERIARENGLAGVPILDVTGGSPGYIRQLGGRPVGSSWLLGGYPGSLDAAIDAVSKDADLLDEAWVLYAPDSPRRIDGLLERFGRSPDRAYRIVDTFRHHLEYDVQILRPVAR